MTTTPIGDLAQFLSTRNRVAATQRDLARTSDEVSTGIKSDIGAALDGDFFRLTSVERGLRLTESYSAAANLAEGFFGGMQRALDVAQAEVVDLGPALVAASGTGQTAQLLTTAIGAEEGFGLVVSALNTRIAGRSPFAGTETNQTALIAAGDMLAALEGVVAGAPDAATMIAAVDTYFTDAAGGYETAAYQGSATPQSGFIISEGETARTGITALDPAIRRTLAGLALASLLARSAGPTDAASRAAIGDQAGRWMREGYDATTDLRAGLGVLEGRVEAAQTRHRATETALGTERAQLVAADPFEAAVELQAVETRLETLYLMTARLSRLSLANYLS